MSGTASGTPPAGATLASVDPFKDLNEADVSAVALRCQWNRYGPGEQIVLHQDRSRDVFFVVDGKVRATLYSLSGKEVTFRDVLAGEMFGELSAIDGKPRSAYVVAVSESLVASMSDTVFWKVLEDYPTVAAAVLRRLATLVRSLSERVVEFSTLAVKNRIHAELLRLARADTDDAESAVIAPAPTHAEIASRVSTHREAVTRELNRLAHEGLLERRSGRLVIHDVGRLETLVKEVTGD